MVVLVALQAANDLAIPFSNYSYYCRGGVCFETPCIVNERVERQDNFLMNDIMIHLAVSRRPA